MLTVAAYRQTQEPKSVGLVLGLVAAWHFSLHLSNEPSELSQQWASHDDSTININIIVIYCYYYYCCYWSALSIMQLPQYALMSASCMYINVLNS